VSRETWATPWIFAVASAIRDQRPGQGEYGRRSMPSATRLRGTSSIFFGGHTQDASESLAKRRVRVVVNRLYDLEQLPIIFCSNPVALYIRRFVKYSSGISPSSSLNLNPKAERDIAAVAASVSTVQ